MNAPLNVGSLCPDAARSFEFSQNTSFDLAIMNLRPVIRELLLTVGETVGTAAAIAKLRTSPVYVWLQQKIPQLKLSDAQSPRDEAILLFVLLAFVIAGSNESSSANRMGQEERRPDKKRKPAANALTKVKGYLNDGTIDLPLDKASQLWALLDDASNSLLTPRRQRTKDHPSLLMLARVLVLYGFADYHLLLEVAALADIECDDSTAHRYIADAKPP